MNKLKNKLFSVSEQALFAKDFGYFWRFGVVRVVLLLIAFTLSFLLPAVFILCIFIVKEQFTTMVDSSVGYLAMFEGQIYGRAFFYYFNSISTMLLFNLVPIIVSAILTSTFFAGEKQNSTILNLLVSKCSLKNIFRAKLACVLVNSMIITVLSFLTITILTTIIGAFLGALDMFNYVIFIEQLILSPFLIIFTSFVTFILSSKYQSIVEAVMSCGYIATPVIIFYIGQLLGLYDVTGWFLSVLIVVIAVADILFYKFIINRLSSEKLIYNEVKNVY